MAQHEGRVVAAGERRYALRRCDGTLTVDADRLTVQGTPHDNGRDRTPVVIARPDVVALHLRCGLFGVTLTWENASGYRNLVLRTTDVAPLLADLRSTRWPIEVIGWRRPKD